MDSLPLTMTGELTQLLPLPSCWSAIVKSIRSSDSRRKRLRTGDGDLDDDNDELGEQS